jgi:hypothetical protein
MKTLRLVIELDYDNVLWHGDDEPALEWFRDEILGGPLILHSYEAGDEIGEVRVVSYVP